MVPIFYKELGKIVIKTEFRKLNPTHVQCFGAVFPIRTVKSRDLYASIIRHKCSGGSDTTHNVWSDWTGCSVDLVVRSWKYSRVSFEDSFTRTFHYRLVHRALLTRDRASHFLDVPNYCSYCFIRDGNIIREDLKHVFFFCSRAYDLYSDLDQLLAQISGLPYHDMTHLIFGIEFPRSKSRQICFNLLVHTMQRAIWMSKKSYDDNNFDFDILQYLKRILYFDICKCRTLATWDVFLNTFGGAHGLILVKLVKTRKCNIGFLMKNSGIGPKNEAEKSGISQE